MMTMPDQPARCVGCPSTAVALVEVGRHQVWLCRACECWLARPAVVTGSRGRVLA
jgi:hypothetical protein